MKRTEHVEKVEKTPKRRKVKSKRDEVQKIESEEKEQQHEYESEVLLDIDQAGSVQGDYDDDDEYGDYIELPELPPPSSDEDEDEDIQKRKGDNTGKMTRQEAAIARGKFDQDAERTVFVGNLPVDCEKKEIKRLFVDCGPITSVRFRCAVVKKEKTPKKAAAIRREHFHPEVDRINAFVKFANASSLSEALKHNNHVIRDHHIRVDYCQQRGGKYGASFQPVQHDNERCVFVGNLPFVCNEEKLRAHFAIVPKVKEEEMEGNENVKTENENRKEIAAGDGIVYVRLIRDRHSGLGKGFGYIQFEDVDAVQQVIDAKDGSEFDGRRLRVFRSTTNTGSRVSTKPSKGKKAKQAKAMSREQQAEKSMLRRKWFFKAGTSTSAGKSSSEVGSYVKGGDKRRQPGVQRKPSVWRNANSATHGQPRRPMHGRRRAKPTNRK